MTGKADVRGPRTGKGNWDYMVGGGDGDDRELVRAGGWSVLRASANVADNLERARRRWGGKGAGRIPVGFYCQLWSAGRHGGIAGEVAGPR